MTTVLQFVVLFVQDGQYEWPKRLVHRCLQILAFACLLFNGAAWSCRRQPHLIIGAVLYTLLFVAETIIVAGHHTK